MNRPAQKRAPDRVPHLLVVEDDDLLRDVLGRFLKMKGFQVSLREDGKSALATFRDGAFDLVLSDVAMPGMDGLQLLKAVKGHNPRIPVILISGHGDVDMVVQALKAGAENFLAKPLSMERLARVVDQALELSFIHPEGRHLFPSFNQVSRFSIPSSNEYIHEVVFQIARSAVAVGFARHDLNNNLKLALVEALTNAMEHGNHWDPELRVEVEARLDREALEVVVSDQGQGFDPASLPDPTSPEQLLCERGRGIFLMRSILDEVEVIPPGNRVVLRKFRSPGQGDEQ